MKDTKSKDYLDGIYQGITLIRALSQKLLEEDRDEMQGQMLGDLELLSLLLQKYELVSQEEYDFLSEKADEEWESSHEPIPAEAFSGMTGPFSLLSGRLPAAERELSGTLDRERELRIRLLERLSEECEDELYNEIAMGLDDELFERLLKEYDIH